VCVWGGGYTVVSAGLPTVTVCQPTGQGGGLGYDGLHNHLREGGNACGHSEHQVRSGQVTQSSRCKVKKP
jgi:hypothetical protein